MPQVGDHVSYSRRILGRARGDRGDPHWMPMVVTAVREDGTIDGVVFSAEPQRIGFRLNAFPVTSASEGGEFGQWRQESQPPVVLGEADVVAVVINEISNNPEGDLVAALRGLMGASWAPPPIETPGQVLITTDVGAEWCDFPAGGQSLSYGSERARRDVRRPRTSPRGRPEPKPEPEPEPEPDKTKGRKRQKG